MKICAVSDLHGHFPEIPECDVLLLGGDYCPFTKINDQHFWFKDVFAPWLESLPVKKIIGVAGNHDLIFEKRPDSMMRMRWDYLQDSGCEFGGLKFWGSPWQPRFFDWAFNADEAELASKWALIPDNIDVLVLHGPPRGFGDFSPYGNERTGSPSLTAKILELQPKLVIAGHIHSGYGEYVIGGTTFYNVSLVNEKYLPVNPITICNI